MFGTLGIHPLTLSNEQFGSLGFAEAFKDRVAEEDCPQ